MNSKNSTCKPTMEERQGVLPLDLPDSERELSRREFLVSPFGKTDHKMVEPAPLTSKQENDPVLTRTYWTSFHVLHGSLQDAVDAGLPRDNIVRLEVLNE